MARLLRNRLHAALFGLVVITLLAIGFQNCSQFASISGSELASLSSVTRSSIVEAGSAWSLELNPTNGNFPTIHSPITILDTHSQVVAGEDHILGYSYGASIITSDDGTGLAYHSYSCAADYSGDGWDRIFYTRSTDRVHWSNPTVPLRATRGSRERSACDPSVIRFNSGDGLYYYLYYGGGDGNMYVARSRTAAGPFLKYTTRGTWEENAADPQYVLAHSDRLPFDSPEQGLTPYYGAGQITVVVLNGSIYAWYLDDTTAAPTGPKSLVLMRRGTSPTQFGDAVVTNIPSEDAISVEVKYDDANQRFVFFGLRDQISPTSRLSIAASSDGITWTTPKEYCPAGSCLPPYSGNMGVSADESNHLIGNEALVTFGAPWDLTGAGCGAGNCWAAWSLYGGGLRFDAGATASDFRVSTSTTARSIVAQPVATPPPPVVSTPIPTPVTNPNDSKSPYRMDQVDVSEELFSKLGAIDGTTNSVYSSKPFATSTNDRNAQLAAWIAGGARNVSRLILKARMNGQGQTIAFATRYSVHLTNPANTAWDYIGEFDAVVGKDGVATISLPPRSTWGVLIIPRVLASDGSAYYFQLDEINLAL